MLSVIDDENKKKILTNWFQCDKNNDPPVYILRPITDHYPNFQNKECEEKRKEAKDLWWADFSSMQASLKDASNLAYAGNHEIIEKYSISGNKTIIFGRYFALSD